MNILLRAISHMYDEYAMGHCHFWSSAGTDAVSCTYNLNGFTSMTAVIRAMESTLADGVDIEHFRKCARHHEGTKFRAIGHGDEKPLIITTTKSERWDSEPCATAEILNVADCERCESLCMTHFGFILGRFPTDAFRQCLASIQNAGPLGNLKRVVVDVDDRFYGEAQRIYDVVVGSTGSALTLRRAGKY